MSMTCRSLDSICTSCSVDGEGTCTCLSSTTTEGNLTAKLYKGVPGAGAFIATASAPTTSIGGATITFAFSTTLFAGTDYFVELETDATATQLALRGESTATPPYAMSMRYLMPSTAWLAYGTPGGRAAFRVNTVACP
jgi:hypothetical protein